MTISLDHLWVSFENPHVVAGAYVNGEFFAFGENWELKDAKTISYDDRTYYTTLQILMYSGCKNDWNTTPNSMRILRGPEIFALLGHNIKTEKPRDHIYDKLKRYYDKLKQMGMLSDLDENAFLKWN